MTAICETIYVNVGKTLFQVSSFEQASELFCKTRDRFGEGASKTPKAFIVNENGKKIARISYNGRVWPLEEWHPDQKPLYDNLASK